MKAALWPIIVIVSYTHWLCMQEVVLGCCYEVQNWFVDVSSLSISLPIAQTTTMHINFVSVS